MKSACDHNVGTGGIGRCIAEQIYHGPGQVIAVADPFQRWRVVHDFNEMRLFGPQLSRHVRLGVARADTIGPNAMRRQLDRQGGGQCLDCTFACMISAQLVARNSHRGTHRGYHYDTTALPLLDHMLGRRLRGEECAIDVDVDQSLDLIPFLIHKGLVQGNPSSSHTVRSARASISRIYLPAVYTTKLNGGLFEGTVQVVLLGHVGVDV